MRVGDSLEMRISWLESWLERVLSISTEDGGRSSFVHDVAFYSKGCLRSSLIPVPYFTFYSGKTHIYPPIRMIRAQGLIRKLSCVMQ